MNDIACSLSCFLTLVLISQCLHVTMLNVINTLLKPFVSSHLSDPSVLVLLYQAWKDVCDGDVMESPWRFCGIVVVVKLLHQNQQIHIRWNPSKCCISLKWMAVSSCHSCSEFTFYHMPPRSKMDEPKEDAALKMCFQRFFDCQAHVLIPYWTASTVNPGENGSTSNLRSKLTPQKEWFLPVSVFQVV